MTSTIVGLGPFCITKYAINKMNLKAPTMPFDWMFSSLKFIQECIEDDFQLLLDRRYIAQNDPMWSNEKSLHLLYNDKIEKDPLIWHHCNYKGDRHPNDYFHMWNHYNLLNDATYGRYCEKIQRLRNALSSKILFIYTLYYGFPIDTVMKFNEYLKQKHIDYHIYVIQCVLTNENKNGNNVSNEGNMTIHKIGVEKWEDEIPDEYLSSIKTNLGNFT